MCTQLVIQVVNSFSVMLEVRLDSLTLSLLAIIILHTSISCNIGSSVNYHHPLLECFVGQKLVIPFDFRDKNDEGTYQETKLPEDLLTIRYNDIRIHGLLLN
jgi:hypothetical protein